MLRPFLLRDASLPSSAIVLLVDEGGEGDHGSPRGVDHADLQLSESGTEDGDRATR